jgi:serine/threonine protein kinase
MEMKLKTIKPIGEGTFATVYLVQDIITGKYYAKKVVKTSKMSKKLLHYFIAEKLILRASIAYNFKNIIKAHRIEKLTNGDYDLILDYCNGGSLHECLYNYINRYRKPFPENIVRYLMEQILIGVECLHKFGIIHRDLKLGNILIKYNNENDRINQNILAAEIKIIDFNVSYFPKSSDPKTFLGTIPNMAPSVIKTYEYPQIEEYDNKIDIWSLGTICYEMLFGKPLFSNIQNNENFNNIINANFTIPETISPKARSFLYCMLQKDGINRLSCTQLLNHEFIKENFFIDQTSDYDKIPIINKNYNQNITNIIFNDVKGKKINIPVDENTKIQDVIRLYFHRIKRPEFTHNYHNKFSFLFNGKNLRYSLNNTVKNMKIMSYCTIQVYKI